MHEGITDFPICLQGLTFFQNNQFSYLKEHNRTFFAPSRDV